MDSAPAPAPAPAPTEDVERPPQRDLRTSLVVIPVLLVVVPVLVYLFFSAIRGGEDTLPENLHTVIHGGANQRKQAALSLVAQVMANHERALAGREPRFDPGPDFLGDLQRAWEATAEDGNLHIRLALARVLVIYEDPGVQQKLVELLHLPEGRDDDGRIRFGALEVLGTLGDPATAPEVIPFLDHPDLYLQLAAAAALQAMPAEASVEALKGVLDDPSLELRGMAAISLSHLRDASGAAVLLELIDPGIYVAIHRAEPRKYADDRIVQNSRIRALQALARLGRAEDAPVLEQLAADEPDPAVREAAMRAHRDHRNRIGDRGPSAPLGKPD